jgi:hypothetical protein
VRFGLIPFRSPLLWESRLISLRRATEMFQFAHGPRPSLWIEEVVSRHHSGRVAPFGFSRLIAWMQLPLNVSSVSTSFIGLTRLGIHLVLFLACYAPVLADGSALREGSCVLCLPLLLQLFALGKIEVIILLVQLFKVHVDLSLRPINWNVESHLGLIWYSHRVTCCHSSNPTLPWRSTWDPLLR